MKEEINKPPAPVVVDPNEAQAEIERQKRHPNVVRMQMGGLADAQLEQITRDDSRRQVDRDVAAEILAIRKTEASAKEAAASRETRRQAAREASDAPEEPKPVSAATGQRRASEGPSENQLAAEQFAEIIGKSGLVAKARPTQRIQGREVHDGWTVNVRDEKAEIGVVACWYGRRHFIAFVEITGHSDRTVETAEMMRAVFDAAKGGLALVDKGKLALLREKAWKYEQLAK